MIEAEYIEVAENAAIQGFNLLKICAVEQETPKFSGTLPREMKLGVDLLVEQKITSVLIETGLPVLSEESGLFNEYRDTDYIWIVDPIDGTVNLRRNIGPCNISICLLKQMVPIFGLILEIQTGQIVTGGKDFASTCDKLSICVSKNENPLESILFTGFPSRFSFNDSAWSSYRKQMQRFGKVRMIGSASASLVAIAKGLAEVYFERDIMFWDVAAGLAIVQGAGGAIQFSHKALADPGEVWASNGKF